MSWGATSKEAENTTFFEEMPKTLQKFKFTFCILLCDDLSRSRHIGIPP